MTSELIAQAEALPCPHCGESPVVHDIEPHGHPLSGLPEFKGSSCVECGCGAGMIADDRVTVLARWNLRAQAQAEQPAEQGEPVAWHHPTLGFMLNSTVKANGRRLGPSWTPLYARPDPRLAEYRAGLIKLRAALHNLSFKDAAITAALEQIHKILEEQ